MTPTLKRTTIKEVARAAGVSIQTVSRVINNHPDVADETRQKIQQIIVDLDYRPSALARSLIQQRTCTLGVVTAGLKYIGPSFTLNGITSKAEQYGYAILLEELPGFHVNQVAQRMDSLLARHADGIIWAIPEIGDNRLWLEQGNLLLPVPVVFLTMQTRPEVTSVSYDNFWGGCLATQHLINSGYRNIGHIRGPSDWWEAEQRKSGWQFSLEQAGMEVHEFQCAEGNWSSASGAAAFKELSTNFKNIDAVFAANDQMAYGVLQTAWKLGLRVPEELGVVGFDGLAESAYVWPPLSTVYQDLNKLGSLAVDKLVEAIDFQNDDNSPVELTHEILKPELIIRQSSQSSRSKEALGEAEKS
jgi:LacI family transcriptional regulator